MTGGALARLRIPPNAVTLAGAVLAGLSGWLILERRYQLAGWVLVASGISDFLDGAVARASQRTTLAGSLLDSVTDRVSDAVIFGALAWVAARDGRPWLAALAVAGLGIVPLVSYVRAKAESLGLNCKVGLMERAERIFVLCAGLVFGLVPAALAIIAVVSAATLAQRIVHVVRQA